jgi:ferric-dicitrate binding protein FerR (iron transport regulator)
MSENDKNSIPVELIARFLSGEADTDQIIDLESWKALSAENRRIFEQYRHIWETTGRLGAYSNIDLDYEWHLFQGKLNLRESSKKQHQLRLYHNLRIAAMVAVALVFSFLALFITRSINVTTVAAKGELKTIQLPDKSVVSLYPGSEISWPSRFGKKNRTVRLEGEGFFEVTPDPNLPFLINCKGIHVEVIGTSFNLSAFPGNSAVTLVVETGRVAIHASGKESAPEYAEKGEKVVYSRRDNQALKVKNNDPNFNAWKTGIIYFNNTPLRDAAAILSKVYNTVVEIAPDSNSACPVTVVFENKTLDYVLETLQATLDLEIERKAGKIILSGEGC